MPSKIEGANREFIKRVIELYEQGKDIERIMFSLNLPYEEPEENYLFFLLLRAQLNTAIKHSR